MIESWITALQEWTDSLPEAVAWLGVALVGAIPFVESYFGAVIGVAAGLGTPVAILAAVIGNIVSMLAFVMSAGAVRDRVVDAGREEPARRKRLRTAFDRWGVPGVSLLGQSILPSQITATAMVSFGASRRAVIIWQSISITLWGVAFGLLASQGLQFISD